MYLLFDVPPVAEGVGVFAAVVFFLVFAAMALIAFKVLRRTMRMAFRMMIVIILLAIAVGGSAAFYFGASSRPSHPTRKVIQPK